MRGISATEWMLAIFVFTSFLIFYLHMINLKIFEQTKKNIEKTSTEDYILSLLKGLEKKYYVVNYEIEVPYYAKSYFCSISNSSIKRDFCEKFPIYYPLNLSFLTNYTGVINGTYDSFYHPIDGLFMYANFSEFTKCKNSNYVLVKIYNPNDDDLKDYQIFIISPTIREWLKEGKHLLVKDLQGNYYYFCYHHKNFVCNSTPNNAYGIWVKVNIPKNSFIILNLSYSENSNNYEKNGEDIFDFYDHFEYSNLDDFEDEWNIQNYGKNGNINCERVDDTRWRCYGQIVIGDYSDKLLLQSRTSLLNNDYVVFYKIKGEKYSDYPPNSYLKLYNKKRIFYLNYDAFNFFVCNNCSGRIEIYDKWDYRECVEWFGIVCRRYIYYFYFNFTLDYIIVKKQAPIEPFVEILEEPYCEKEYKLIIGPYIKYNYANDISNETDILGNWIGIKNNYIKYIEVPITDTNPTGVFENAIKDSLSNFYYWNYLYYISDILEQNGEFGKNASIAIFNKFYGSINNWSYTLRKILFSNSRWFVVNLEIISNVDNNLFSYFLIDLIGSLIPGTNDKVRSYFVSEYFDYNYTPYYEPLQISLYSVGFFKPDKYLLFSFNYPTEINYYVTPSYDTVYSYFKKTFSKNEYKNFLIYTYAYNKTINNFEDFIIHFKLPKFKVSSVTSVYAIPLYNLAIPNGTYIYFKKSKKGFGDENVFRKYRYKHSYRVYVFYDNWLYEDIAVVYLQ